MTEPTAAEDLYRAVVSSGRLPHLRRLTYRCAPRRCLLLEAVETPLGIVVHQNRYKYSEPENLRRSSEDGRRANTYDGRNHWRERTYYLAESALSWPGDDGAGQALTCDHVLEHYLSSATFAADWERHADEVRVHP